MNSLIRIIRHMVLDCQLGTGSCLAIATDYEMIMELQNYRELCTHSSIHLYNKQVFSSCKHKQSGNSAYSKNRIKFFKKLTINDIVCIILLGKAGTLYANTLYELSIGTSDWCIHLTPCNYTHPIMCCR